MRCTVLTLTPCVVAITRTLGEPSYVPPHGSQPRPRPPQASAHPLLDHRPLELGERAHHLEHGLASRRRGVEALLVQKEVDAECVQLGQERDQVLQAAAQAIDGPCHDHVELPTGRGLAELVERRALVATFWRRCLW
jgi:hypothetical protein